MVDANMAQTMSQAPRYSVVIPVYNSSEVVGETIDACVAYCERKGLSYELILVNDGSRDDSWQVLSRKFAEHPRLAAINLLRNYGQHTAVLAGLQYSRGEYVVTLDDDLQNPPEEIDRLIAQAETGHDVVFGRFRRKRHSPLRRLGSQIVNAINRRVFDKPRDLVLTNFRLLHRRVVDRIVAHKTLYPYINGLALMYAQRPANVEVEHRRRAAGRSTYGLVKIIELVMRILFNYSSYPLRMASMLGIVVAVMSFFLAGYFFLHGLFVGTSVPGWASVAVMLSFFNGLSLLLLAMLGEYMIRILQQVSHIENYHVVEVLRREA
jgi:glycosyltransferase involved in cell wall biosynthesis